MVNQTFAIVYIEDGDKIDFDTSSIPYDLILPLRGHLGWDHQKQLGARCAPSFREERLLQWQRYLDKCQADGADPKQQYIDFGV
ncbi:hypothetical protein [Mucilaginibacter sp. 10B2]|uniref:hypothetical protein n=1 Tax=Mucilaginibacter sp. 10B2 TaxID=3048574 RepID=UPI002B238A43|nr:hypothetical protein [Mucilaginibacter sp. 10B2]MEB0278958.1 hypothetical protein [Mucilaginibacter sp. 10B2]